MRQRRDNTVSERGFTMVEVIFATLILMLGSLAMLSVVDASTRGNFRSEQSQVAVGQIQGELERIKQMPYSQIAMTGAPTSSTDEDDPAWRVSGNKFAIGEEGTDLRPMVINGSALAGGGTVSGGTISPSPTSFASGDITGTLRRYVVWINDPKCPDMVCPGAQDLKRVIVAATLNNTAAGGERAYEELHTDIVDPDVSPVVDSVPEGDGEEGSFATFWITDTPCNHDERQDPTGDHATHNTLGSCSDGVTSGEDAGAPDLMFTEPPPLTPGLPPDEQPLYDYATDVEPHTGGDADRGLQLRNSTVPGCIFSPSVEDGTPGQKVHSWLTPPIPNGFEILLDGEATLSLWTRTLNGAQHTGRICVFLFTRKLNLAGQPVDVPMVNQELPDATWFP
ncbi:MAG TPA: hypothetical protein VD766_03245, partial [Solirubrobacterales bacterium]|nr:hypothetical protein [Solirubrobacterales bacterium]